MPLLSHTVTCTPTVVQARSFNWYSGPLADPLSFSVSLYSDNACLNLIATFTRGQTVTNISAQFPAIRYTAR